MRPGLAMVVVWLGGACSVLNGLDERPRGGDGGGDGGSGEGDGGDPADAPGCDATPMTPVQVPATIHIMFDVSGSMVTPLGQSGPPRYLALADALTREGGPLDQVDHMTRFGLTTFTSDPTTGMCPLLQHQASVLEARGPLAATLSAQDPSNFTVGESFAPTFAQLMGDPGTPPRTLWVFTDTEPHTCASQAENGTPLAMTAILDALGAGIATRVVRLGMDDPATTSFQEMAAAAGSELAEAQDTIQLDAVIATTIDELAVCRFDLGVEVDPTRATVTLDGRVLAHGDEWTLDGMTLIVIGDACDEYRGNPTAQVLFSSC